MAEVFKGTGTLEFIFQSQTESIEKSIEKLKKIAQNVEIGPDSQKEALKLVTVLEQELKRISSINPEDFTPDIAAVFLKRLNPVYREVEKFNEKVLDSATQSSTVQLKLASENVKTLTKEIAVAEKEMERIKEKFPETLSDPNDPTSGTGERTFKTSRAETLFIKEAAEAEGLMDKMEKSTGKTRDNFSDMWRNVKKVNTTVESNATLNEKVNEGLEKGKSAKEIINDLSKKEREEAEELIKTKHKNLTLEQALEQAIIKKSLEEKKSNFLAEQQNKLAEIQNTYELKSVRLTQEKSRYDKELQNVQQQTTPETEKLLNLYIELDDVIQKGTTNASVSMSELRDNAIDARKAQKDFNEETNKQTGTLAKATRQVFNYGVAFTALRRIYRETLRTVKDLDQALTEMAIVTSMSRKETWQLVGTMQQLARETGFTTTEIAKLSTIYFRQGRTLREVIELTRVAAMGARIAGISAAESADFLTSAVNAFQLSADQALAVSDRFAALAAQSASSYEELAVGLSKFAAQANIAGISIDFAMGLLSKGIETTREAPETIGTALKTVIARMRELTDLGKTFEDGMDISRVETALRQVGVALRDEQGQFRNLELVLTELGRKFATLNTNQQASVAVALAGTRQQSRLIAIMQDFDRTLELVDIAQESAGATMAQHTQFMRGMEGATIGLQNAYQEFITTITDSEIIIGIVRGLSGAITSLTSALDSIGFSGQLATVSLIGMLAVLKLKAPVMKLMTGMMGSQIFLQKRQIELDKLDIKIKKIKKILTKENITDQTMQLKLEELRNLQKEKNRLLSVKELVVQKLKFLSDKKEIANLIAQINGYFGLAAAKKTAGAASLGLLGSVKLLGTAFLGLAKVIFMTPIGWIAAAIFLLIKGFRDLKEGNDTLAASFASSFTGIVEAVKTLFGSIMGLIRAVFQLGGIFKIALKFSLLPFMIVVKLLSAAADVLTIVFNAIAEGLKGWTESVQNALESNELLAKALQWILNTGEKIQNWFKAVRLEAERSTERLRILNSTYEELNENLQQTRKELQSENYELIQKNRSMQDLIKTHEELIRLQTLGAVSGANFAEQLSNLRREIESLDPDLLRFDPITGELSIPLTLKAFSDEIAKNQQTIAQNLFDIASESLNLLGRDPQRFLQGSGIQDIQNFLINMIDEDLTREQVDALKEYYKNLIRTRVEAGEDLTPQSLLDIARDTSINRDVGILIRSVSDFNKVIDENQNGILGLKKAFEEISSTMEGELQNAFRASFVDFAAVFDLLDGRTEQTQQSMARILTVIGQTPEALNRLVSSFENTNLTLEEFILTAGHMADSIAAANENMTDNEAASRALIAIAATLDDGALSAQLYSQAVGRSLLEATQAADLLASRIENLSDVQSKFLEGSLTNQELFDFVESYADFFGDPDFFDAFQRGLDLSNFLIRDTIKQAEEYRIQLIAVTQRLEVATRENSGYTESQIRALRAEQNRLILLNQYQGALRGVTDTQLEYNNAVRSYELAVRMGIDATDLQIRKVDALQRNVGNSLKIISDNLESTENNIAKIFKEGRISLSADEIYEVVDGVVVLKDAYFGLGAEIRKALDIQFQFIESGLEGIYNIFETLMNETLALEEKMAEDRIKVYEDYFAALDRLEKQRARKVQREDLVGQLARLEGATDERSRRRALEIRQELNRLDEKSAEEIIKESRENLINAINQAVEQTRALFREVFTQFLSTGAGVGESAGQALYSMLKDYGLLGENNKGWADLEARFVIDDEDLPDLDPIEFNEEQLAFFLQAVADLEAMLSDPDIDPDDESQAENRNLLTINRAQAATLTEIKNIMERAFPARGSGDDPDQITDSGTRGPNIRDVDIDVPEDSQLSFRDMNRKADEALINMAIDYVKELFRVIYRPSQYQPTGQNELAGERRKGGMVNKTAPYMLHGTDNRPEAVLNQAQTEMFVGLRNALEKSVADRNPGMSAINIENISISTASMNNNQDFNRAGETLAESFRNAIQRKGITVNTNKV